MPTAGSDQSTAVFRRTKGVCDLDQAGVDFADTTLRVDEHRKDREKQYDHDFRGGAKAEPEHEDGDKCDHRSGIKSRDGDIEQTCDHLTPTAEQAESDPDQRTISRV